MKKNFYLLIILISIISCKEKSDTTNTNKQLEPVVEVNELLSDWNKWWSYHYHGISLVSDFKSLDTNFNPISKEKFLMDLTSGNYIPVEMKSDGSKIYKLYEIPPNSISSFKSAIKYQAQRAYQFYKLEGTPFPQFEAKNLNDEFINNESLYGKTTIIKTWFIGC